MRRHAFHVSCLLALAALLVFAGCQTSAPPADPTPAHAALPALPDDGPGWSKYLATTTFTVPGTATYSTSGEPGVAESAGWLTMDGDQAGEMAWAIWQFPLPEETSVEDIAINLQQSGFNEYWVLWADYDQGRWVPDAEKARKGSGPVYPPAGVRSPGNYVYMAIVVLPGYKINIDTLEFTHDGTPPSTDPIFDQFEDNDDTETATPLDPGLYRASIHETIRIDMSDPNEYKDYWDFYKIHVDAGKHLTVTMRFEVFNHFLDPLSFNDLDLLFFHGPTQNPLNDFDQDLSSYRTYYQAFEQVDYDATAGGDRYIGIRGDFGDIQSPDNNAEYDLGVYVSDAVYTVSGAVTQGGETPAWDHIVFLEPGNFNAVTPYDPLSGTFTIPGVPNGTYTLKVASTSRSSAGPYDYVWDQTQEVTVNNGNVGGIIIDIGPDP